MLRSLKRILGRSSEREPMVFTVYTRVGCGCCVKAKDVLERFQGRYGFRLEEVDVDGSPELKERYGLEVPVVVLDGRVRFRGSVNPTMLERLLSSAGPEVASPEV